MKLEQTYEKASKAVDTKDLLNHLAWTDVIEPALRKHRDMLATELVSKVLNTPSQTGMNTEQIAGRIAGIDWLFNFLKRLMQEGEQAKALLKSLDINIT